MSVLPKPLRSLYYWINEQGAPGKFVVNAGSYAFMAGVKILGIKPWEDLAALSVVSQRYKFIYIGIPKVASRTFRDVFLANELLGDDIEWSEQPRGFQKHMERHPDYFVFGFVRNPWDRIVSCYNSKIAGSEPGKEARIMSFYHGLKPHMSFDGFVRWLCSEEGRDDIADRHWISQHRFFYQGNQCRAGFIGRYESLEHDWQEICKTLNIPATPLPRKGWISEGNYRDLYTEETRNLIAKRYARDIELFQYKF